MSKSGESASPGVSLSPGFLGGILAPGLTGGTGPVFLASPDLSPALPSFLSSASARAALAASHRFSSALVRGLLAGLDGLGGFLGLADFLTAAVLAAAGLAAGF